MLTNWDDVDVPEAGKTDFEPIPQGTRADVEILEMTPQETQSGQAILDTTLRIVSGPYENRRIFTKIWQAKTEDGTLKTGDRKWASKQNLAFLMSFGLDPGSFDFENPSGFEGLVGNVTVKTRDYNGKTYNDVQYYNVPQPAAS